MNGLFCEHSPQNVGIILIDLYFPKLYVDQNELEIFDNVSKGKYVIGLGQNKMAFTSDCEDINSLCLTVVNNLMENAAKMGITYEMIGRMDVGTETLIDKSKSIKSTLMQLFSNNSSDSQTPAYDIEGADNINACYGATAALFNAINWIQSESWDGRYALVVGADIAVYAEGAARPTGGAGAIAMLVGPNAPLLIDPVRCSFSKNLYDFYKPRLDSEYPVVDGPLSIKSYIQAVDFCYTGYRHKIQQSKNGSQEATLPHVSTSNAYFDFLCFHSPYAKLVEKSVARLAYLDLQHANTLLLNNTGKSFLNKNNLEEIFSQWPNVKKHVSKKPEDTYMDKELEKDFCNYANKTIFQTKTLPGLYVAKNIGNMYTPSLYGSLISTLIHVFGMAQKTTNSETTYVNGLNSQETAQKTQNSENGSLGLGSGDGPTINNTQKMKIGMFSYGSGAIATFFTITMYPERVSPHMKQMLHKIYFRLHDESQRIKVLPETYAKTLKSREETHLSAPYTPTIHTEELYPGTFYLVNMDEKYRRTYAKFHN